MLIAEIGSGRLGLHPERVEIDGCSHLRWRFGRGQGRVIVLAHHDTVWPIGSLRSHPWSNFAAASARSASVLVPLS